MLCLSHQATINMFDIIADGHDEKVLDWSEELLQRVQTSDIQEQVTYCYQCNLNYNIILFYIIL